MTAKKSFITPIFAAVIAAAILLPSLCFAQESMRSPVLKQFEDAGGSVEFIGSSHGLDGWVVKDGKGEVKQTVYTTQDGAVVVGMLFSPDNKNETVAQLTAYKQRLSGSQSAAPGAEASTSKSEKLYALIEEKANWVALGPTGAPYIYMFMNVSCDHCQNFWKDIEDYVKNGKLQVRLIPYGKSKDNREGGAALLSVDNPEESWRAYVGGDKAALGADKVKGGSYEKLDSNTDIVNAWKLGGPPFTLYRRPGDGILAAVVGRPGNPMLMMAELVK